VAQSGGRTAPWAWATSRASPLFEGKGGGRAAAAGIPSPSSRLDQAARSEERRPAGSEATISSPLSSTLSAWQEGQREGKKPSVETEQMEELGGSLVQVYIYIVFFMV
jgi:hypothetical protein